VLLGLSAVILYVQYQSGPRDPDAAEHPAVKDVTQLAEKKDSNGLLQYTKNDDLVVAQRAVSALGRIGDTDSLRQAMTDTRPEVRSVAVAELADRADASQLPVLGHYLEDSDSGVRLTAIRGIASIRDFSIFDYLVPMLSDPQPAVRRGAIQAIEARMGVKFSDFDPNDPAASQRAVSRIRTMLPKFKARFDNVNQIESQKGKKK
jgi:HEAT repeat protein